MGMGNVKRHFSLGIKNLINVQDYQVMSATIIINNFTEIHGVPRINPFCCPKSAFLHSITETPQHDQEVPVSIFAQDFYYL